jgi:hypothetical protein
MFTTLPIRMMGAEGPREFDAVVNVNHIATAFPYEVDEKEMCSIMMVGGHKLTVNMPFVALSQRLLELRETPH